MFLTLTYFFQTNCNGLDGWGRKRRDVTPINVIGEITSNGKQPRAAPLDHIRNKRQTAAGDLDIDVGGRVKIVEKYSEIRK